LLPNPINGAITTAVLLPCIFAGNRNVVVFPAEVRRTMNGGLVPTTTDSVANFWCPDLQLYPAPYQKVIIRSISSIFSCPVINPLNPVTSRAGLTYTDSTPLNRWLGGSVVGLRRCSDRRRRLGSYRDRDGLRACGRWIVVNGLASGGTLGRRRSGHCGRFA
jgi:hypothetical protein